jgi:hypothetical protein
MQRYRTCPRGDATEGPEADGVLQLVIGVDGDVPRCHEQ